MKEIQQAHINLCMLRCWYRKTVKLNSWFHKLKNNKSPDLKIFARG